MSSAPKNTKAPLAKEAPSNNPHALNFKRFAIAWLGFAVLLTLLFREFLFHPETLLSTSDQLNNLGNRFFRTTFWLPQWDPSKLGGLPTLDATFGDVYHPLSFFHLIFDPARALGYKFIVTIWIAFGSCLILGSRLTQNWGWGTVLALAYALNPQFFTHIFPGHDGKMIVMSILPLAIFAVHVFMKDHKTWALPLFIFCIVYIMISPHIQMSYFSFWGLGIYSVYLNFMQNQDSVAKKVVRQALIGLALGTAVAISAIQILPPMDYVKHYSVRGSGEKTTYGHAVSWSIHPEEAAAMVLPGFIEAIPDPKHPEEVYWGHNPFKLSADTPGIILILLALAGMSIRDKLTRRDNLFWLGTASVAVLYALGAHTPIFQIFFDYIPGVNKFRASSMALFWMPMALIMIAGNALREGLDKTLNSKAILGFSAFALTIALSRMMWTGVLGGLGIVLVIALAVVVNSVWFARHQEKTFHWVKYAGQNLKRIFKNKDWEVLVLNLPILILLLVVIQHQDFSNPELKPYFTDLKDAVMQSTSGAVWFSFVVLLGLSYGLQYIVKSGWNPPAILTGILLLIAVDTSLVNTRFIQTADRSDFLQPENPYVAEIKKRTQADSLNDFRVMTFTNTQALNQNIFPFFNLRNASGFHDNEMASYRTFREAANVPVYIQLNPMRAQLEANASNPQAQQYMAMLKESENITPAFLDLMNVGYVLLQGEQGIQIIANPTALPRTWVYHQVQKVSDEGVLATLKQGFPYTQTALVSEKDADQLNPSLLQNSTPLLALPATRPAPESRITAIPSPDQMKIEVNTTQAGVLMISNNYHPDWKALVDGQPTPVLKLFGTLQGVSVAAGQHKVELSFKSSVVEKSKNFIYIGLGLWVAFFALAIIRRRI